MVILDTTACIDFLYGYRDLEPILSQIEESFQLTTVSIYEVSIGLERTKRKISESRYKELKTKWLEFIHGLEILALGYKEAEKAAEIHDYLESKGTMIDDNDILIAGIALSNGMQKILTRNAKHFRNIEDMDVIEYNQANSNQKNP